MKLITTHAPLPAWKNIIGLLMPGSGTTVNSLVPWHSENELTGCLSRSAWSLAIIALWRSKYTSNKNVVVWVPDFFCNASLAPLRELGVSLVFYPVTEKMQPDKDTCMQMAEANEPDIFILVHYFGQPNETVFAKEFCIKHHAWLIEDAAHVLRPEKGIGVSGDFVLYSPHKHLPIPDGAVLVIRGSGPSKINIGEENIFGNTSAWPSQLKETAQKMGTYVRSNELNSFIWLAKRILQKIGIRPRIGGAVPFIESTTAAKKNGVNILEPPAQSFIGRRLLRSSATQLETISSKRKENRLRWDNILLEQTKQEYPFFKTLQALEEATPYLATYQTDATSAEKIYDAWLNKGLPVLTWPDLAPEVIADIDTHSKAWNLRHTRLYLPVHQSLSLAGIKLFEN